jgi:hypothetical protein
MWWRVLIAGGLLAGLLSACAVVDPVDRRYDTVARSLATARNESIFLNLVRASHDYPLAFTTIANVTPSMTNTTSLGLPSFLVGPGHVVAGATSAISTFPSSSPYRDTLFSNSTASNSTAVSTNFSVSTQETGSFYDGFLKPVDLQTLDYFIRQGYPPELLFWLFTDSFEFNKPGVKIGYRYDPPNDYGCPNIRGSNLCFTDWVHIAVYTGLTVEELYLQKGAGGSGGGKSGGSSAKSDSSSGSKPETIIYPRFCFNPVLAHRAQQIMGPEKSAEIKELLGVPETTLQPKCGSPWNPLLTADTPQPALLPLHVGPYTFTIVPRSAYGVFEFLGAVMRMERKEVPPEQGAYVPAGREDLTQPPVLWSVPEDAHLMTVLQDYGGYCFVHTHFFDGDYCVPEKADTTKRIFSLLAQLIAIQTTATDLSITPLVRVIQ